MLISFRSASQGIISNSPLLIDLSELSGKHLGISVLCANRITQQRLSQTQISRRRQVLL
jgi:hypothetical protein